MQTVLKVSPATLKKMAATYPANRKLPAGAAFAAKLAQVTITGYKSGKVLFQGAQAAAEAARWGEVSAAGAGKASVASDLPANFARLSVLGSDEVGTGSYFGPLTPAAVYVASDQVAQLEKLGVRDSKQLTDPQIRQLAHQITATCPYHVLDLAPHDYNRLIKQYNQAQLKALCHNFVLLKVEEKIAPTKPAAVLIDQFVKPATYFKYLRGQEEILRQDVYFKEKGEGYHVAVAAASIVARAYSLATIDRLSEAAGMTLPIGAGVKVDQIGKQLVAKGLDLDQFAKLHFANTKRIRGVR